MRTDHFPQRRSVVAQACLASLLLCTGGVALAQTASTVPAPKPAVADGSNTEQLERVTITSEKRATVLDMTPDAVTVLNGSKLKERGATGLADVVTAVPNTSFTTGLGATQLFVRGIGNVFVTAGGDPGVALYADGAYISDQTSSNTSLFDVQRVEILRGPQGALYGRNATGGAMNILSAQPTDTFTGQVGVLLGDYGRRESEGFVSGPITGSTNMRLSYQVKALDGFARNQLAGQNFGPVLPGGPNTAGPGALDDLGSQALRLQSATDLGQGAGLRVIAGYYRQSDNGPGNAVLVEPTPMIPQLLFGATPSTDPRSVKSQGASNKIDVNTLQAIYDQPVGANQLTVVASWRKSSAVTLADGDMTEAPVATTQFKTSSTDASIDAHLASEDKGPLTWLVGASYLQFDQSQDVDVAAQVPVGFLVPGAPFTVPVPGGVEFLLGGNLRARSTAVYGGMRYALTPRLALLGGLRFSQESKSADEYQKIAAFGINTTGSPSANWSSVPGSLGLEYQVDADTLAYGKLSHGFKAGAVNLGAVQPSPVKPETVTSLEVGLKTSFANKRGSFALALFGSDYKDMQVVQIGQASPILANAAGARITGLEMETVYKPVSSVTLGAGLGLMDPRYTDFINIDQRHNPLGPAVNTSGNQLANVSKSQLSLNAEWVQNLDGYRASYRVDYVWRDRFFFTEFNTADAMQEAYGLLNLSASLRPSQGRWKLYGYVKNANNVTALSSMSISSPVLGSARTVNYVPPRYVGVGVTYDF